MSEEDVVEIKTVKQALEMSVELWEELVKSGSRVKGDAADALGYTDMQNDCPLCELIKQRGEYRAVDDWLMGSCKKTSCPLAVSRRDCLNYSYGMWLDAFSMKKRRHYATLFTEELQEILRRIEG